MTLMLAMGAQVPVTVEWGKNPLVQTQGTQTSDSDDKERKQSCVDIVKVAQNDHTTEWNDSMLEVGPKTQ